MFTSVSQLLQKIRDNFLKLIEILNEAQENFTVTKDVDIVLQFWKFKTIFAELKKKLIVPKESIFNIHKTKLVH